MICTGENTPKGPCSFCADKPAVALWMGPGSNMIFVCYDCAKTKAVQMIADAMCSDGRWPSDLVAAEIMKAFWRAALIAKMNQKREAVAAGRMKDGPPTQLTP